MDGGRHDQPAAARRAHGLRALAGRHFHRIAAGRRQQARTRALGVDAQYRRLVGRFQAGGDEFRQRQLLRCSAGNSCRHCQPRARAPSTSYGDDDGHGTADRRASAKSSSAMSRSSRHQRHGGQRAWRWPPWCRRMARSFAMRTAISQSTNVARRNSSPMAPSSCTIARRRRQS